jgi:hypothetical protein
MSNFLACSPGMSQLALTDLDNDKALVEQPTVDRELAARSEKPEL